MPRVEAGRGLRPAAVLASMVIVEAAMHACANAGDTTLSLRFGEGTSPAAHALYTKLGFRAGG